LSPVCVSAAADILKRIDKRVDPCTDFYKFSCGGLDNKLNPIPDDKSSVSTAALLQLDIDKKIRGGFLFAFLSSLAQSSLPSDLHVICVVFTIHVSSPYYLSLPILIFIDELIAFFY
jgi:hypothetical protein